MVYYTGDIHGSKYEVVRFCKRMNLTADSVTDAQGNSIKYELDSKGKVTKKIYPDGNTVTISNFPKCNDIYFLPILR